MPCHSNTWSQRTSTTTLSWHHIQGKAASGSKSIETLTCRSYRVSLTVARPDPQPAAAPHVTFYFCSEPVGVEMAFAPWSYSNWFIYSERFAVLVKCRIFEAESFELLASLTHHWCDAWRRTRLFFWAVRLWKKKGRGGEKWQKALITSPEPSPKFQLHAWVEK